MQDQNKKELTREFGISSLAVSNRTSVVVMTFIIAALGIFAYLTMPKESFPEVVIPTVYVGTVYPGNSPADMENLITRPIEKELKSINNVKNIRSTSVQDFSSIVIEFNPNVEISKALLDVKDAVDKSKSELPTDLDKDPDVLEINTSDFPIMNINISGNYSEVELKKFGEFLEDEIEKLPQVSKAELRGAVEREIRIDADIFKMEAMGVAFSDISDAVRSENMTISGGSLLTGDFRRSLRITGEFDTPNELEGVIVKTEGNRIVYLSDVADVRDTFKERTSYARSKNLPVVTVNVVKRSGENLLDASDEIKKIIDNAKANRFPDDLDISITNDQSKATRTQVKDLENNIITAVILVVVTLMFFLGFRNALFVGIAIPLSMFISFLVLNSLGITLNLMVLFSLIFALGLLVDNGIVVVENTYRLMQEGKSSIQAAKEGVAEVAWPIITSTVTTLMAFMPLIFWDDIVGEFMKYLPITLIVVLSSSLFVALIINPVLTSIYMKVQDLSKEKPKKKALIVVAVVTFVAILFYFFGNVFMGNICSLIAILTLFNIFFMRKAIAWFQDVFLVYLEDLYEKTLNYTLGGIRPYIAFGGTVVLLVLSVMLLYVRAPKVLFFPDNQPALVNIYLEKPMGTDIEATNTMVLGFESDLSKLLEPYKNIIESTITQIGEGTGDEMEGPSGAATPHKAKITLAFVEYQFREGINTNRIMEDIRDLSENYPGIQVTVGKQTAGPPVGKPINIESSGEDFEKLVEFVGYARRMIDEANIAGIEELKTDLEMGNPELVVNINRENARRFGLSTYAIANELRTALFGLEVSKYKEGEDDYPIQLRLADEYRYDVAALINKKVNFRDVTGSVKEIPISAVADLEYTSTYGSVKRKDLNRVITLSSNVTDGYNPTEINQRIQNLFTNVEIPDGVTVRFTGEQEEQNKSAEFLFRALLIAISLTFLVMVAQFNSVTSPFIIMATVVFSTIGVFLGLVAFNMDFVIIMTGIGIISLAAVVVNNAIVLIDYTNLVRQRKRMELGVGEDEFLPYRELLSSIVQAGKTRLRPVLLTAITTVLGLIPLAMGVNIDFSSLMSSFDPQFYFGGDNADFWGPMAWTVIFGLTFATFLTLIMVPVMYLLADKANMAFKK